MLSLIKRVVPFFVMCLMGVSLMAMEDQSKARQAGTEPKASSKSITPSHDTKAKDALHYKKTGKAKNKIIILTKLAEEISPRLYELAHLCDIGMYNKDNDFFKRVVRLRVATEFEAMLHEVKETCSLKNFIHFCKSSAIVFDNQPLDLFTIIGVICNFIQPGSAPISIESFDYFTNWQTKFPERQQEWFTFLKEMSVDDFRANTRHIQLAKKNDKNASADRKKVYDHVMNVFLKDAVDLRKAKASAKAADNANAKSDASKEAQGSLANVLQESLQSKKKMGDAAADSGKIENDTSNAVQESQASAPIEVTAYAESPWFRMSTSSKRKALVLGKKIEPNNLMLYYLAMFIDPKELAKDLDMFNDSEEELAKELGMFIDPKEKDVVLLGAVRHCIEKEYEKILKIILPKYSINEFIEASKIFVYNECQFFVTLQDICRFLDKAAPRKMDENLLVTYYRKFQTELPEKLKAWPALVEHTSNADLEKALLKVQVMKAKIIAKGGGDIEVACNAIIKTLKDARAIKAKLKDSKAAEIAPKQKSASERRKEKRKGLEAKAKVQTTDVKAAKDAGIASSEQPILSATCQIAVNTNVKDTSADAEEQKTQPSNQKNEAMASASTEKDTKSKEAQSSKDTASSESPATVTAQSPSAVNNASAEILSAMDAQAVNDFCNNIAREVWPHMDKLDAFIQIGFAHKTNDLIKGAVRYCVEIELKKIFDLVLSKCNLYDFIELCKRNELITTEGILPFNNILASVCPIFEVDAPKNSDDRFFIDLFTKFDEQFEQRMQAWDSLQARTSKHDLQSTFHHIELAKKDASNRIKCACDGVLRVLQDALARKRIHETKTSDTIIAKNDVALKIKQRVTALEKYIQTEGAAQSISGSSLKTLSMHEQIAIKNLAGKIGPHVKKLSALTIIGIINEKDILIKGAVRHCIETEFEKLFKVMHPKYSIKQFIDVSKDWEIGGEIKQPFINYLCVICKILNDTTPEQINDGYLMDFYLKLQTQSPQRLKAWHALIDKTGEEELQKYIEENRSDISSFTTGTVNKNLLDGCITLIRVLLKALDRKKGVNAQAVDKDNVKHDASKDEQTQHTAEISSQHKSSREKRKEKRAQLVAKTKAQSADVKAAKDKDAGTAAEQPVSGVACPVTATISVKDASADKEQKNPIKDQPAQKKIQQTESEKDEMNKAQEHERKHILKATFKALRMEIQKEKLQEAERTKLAINFAQNHAKKRDEKRVKQTIEILRAHARQRKVQALLMQQAEKFKEQKAKKQKMAFFATLKDARETTKNCEDGLYNAYQHAVELKKVEPIWPPDIWRFALHDLYSASKRFVSYYAYKGYSLEKLKDMLVKRDVCLGTGLTKAQFGDVKIMPRGVMLHDFKKQKGLQGQITWRVITEAQKLLYDFTENAGINTPERFLSWLYQDQEAQTLSSQESQMHKLLDATRAHNASRVTALLNAKADVHACNTHGDTALHIAHAHYQPRLIQELINCKADVHVKNTSGCSPLMVIANHMQEDS